MPIIDDSNSGAYLHLAATTRGVSLESGSLKKQSYIRLEHTYEVPISMLEQYSWKRCRAYKIRLSQDSYVELM